MINKPEGSERTPPSSTGGRARKSADERRVEIAGAARAIALTEGLDAVTLRAVAARVGVVSGLVAHYVAGMDELVADTFAELSAVELADVRAGLPEAEAPARLGALLETVLGGSRADMTLVWVQAWALGVRNPHLAARVRDAMDAWRALLTDEIARAMAEGAIPARDPGPLAWHVLAMIDGVGAHSLVGWGEGIDRVRPALRAVSGLLDVPVERFGVAGSLPGA